MDAEFEDQPSKSARKREVTALQKIGEQLVGLSDRELKRMPIDDEELRAAIGLARRIKSNSGLRRQMQLIGKLMRRIDALPLRRALDQLHTQHQTQTDAFHELELVRDRLMSEGITAVEGIVTEFSGADRQHLRQLVLQHQREQKANKAGPASRKIFRYIRELSEID